MTVILPATATRARRTQREHDLAEGGWWCKRCALEGLGHIAAGLCDPYLRAEVVLSTYRRQQAVRIRPQPGRATVGVQYWAGT